MDNTAKQITGKDVERVVFTNKESQDITRKSLTYWQDVRRRDYCMHGIFCTVWLHIDIPELP